MPSQARGSPGRSPATNRSTAELGIDNARRPLTMVLMPMTPPVAGAEGDIGLEPVSRARTLKGRGLSGGDHDAGRGGATRSRWVPDGNCDLTWPHSTGVAKARGRKTIGGDLNDGEVAVGVAGGDDTGEFATVVKDDVDAIVSNDVTIGDDDAVGAPDDTGAMASALTDEDDGRGDLRRDLGDSLGERQPG
jgi:hypothetical protein